MDSPRWLGRYRAKDLSIEDERFRDRRAFSRSMSRQRALAGADFIFGRVNGIIIVSRFPQ